MNKHHDEDVLWDGRHIFLLYDLEKTQIIRQSHLNNIILKENNSFSPVCPQILIKFVLSAKLLTHFHFGSRGKTTLTEQCHNLS